MERIRKLLHDLQQAAMEAPEQHFADLPRPHRVLDMVDGIYQIIIKNRETSEDYAIYASEQLCAKLFTPGLEDTLVIETLIHVLETLRRLSGPSLNQRIRQIFYQQTYSTAFSIPLIEALSD